MPLDLEILGHGVYTPREAARLIGGTAQQVLRWTRGSGPNEPLWHAHFQFLEDSTEISFLDLIELRVVAAMRQAGISMQSIRFAMALAEEKFGIAHPLSSRQFKTDGKELLMDAIENDGNLVSLSKKSPGQKVFSDIVKSSLNDVEYENDTAARWRPKGFSQIVIDPKRNFGDPIIDQYGISTSTIFQEYENGGAAAYLAKIYEIPLKITQQSIAYEESLNTLAERQDGQGFI